MTRETTGIGRWVQRKGVAYQHLFLTGNATAMTRERYTMGAWTLEVSLSQSRPPSASPRIQDSPQDVSLVVMNV